MTLYHDIPRSQGVENGLKRAKQMVDLKWTPVAAMPAGRVVRTAEGNQYVDCFHAPWLPLKGVNYSSVRKYEKFVGFNVSHETYLTAVANPRSIMYTSPQHGVGTRMYSYYGLVCSAFASYVCDLPLRIPCAFWPHDPHLTLVDSSDLRNLQLMDIVLEPKMHIGVITDIERDIDGNVAYITVSEATLPVTIATRFTPEEFRGYWFGTGYGIYRRDDLDRITYEPSPFVRLEGDPDLSVPEMNRSLQPNFGNKANYMLGEEVELDVMEEGWEEIVVSGPESLVLPVAEAKAAFTPGTTGYYTACCRTGERMSAPVEFCVTHIEVKLEKTTVGKEGFTASFRIAEEDEPVSWMVQTPAWGFRGGAGITEAEKASRTVASACVGKAGALEAQPGEYQLIVLAKNKYGIYKSEFCDFTVE